MLLRLLQSLELEKDKFLSAAAAEVRNINSLCGVRQNQQQRNLRGQIRGYTALQVLSQQTVNHLRVLMRLSCLCWFCSGKSWGLNCTFIALDSL